MESTLRSRPWKGNQPPKKILVMRFQAMGDMVITLPYLQSLKRQYPDTSLCLLTRREVAPIPEALVLFDEVMALGGGRNAKVQFLLSLLLLPKLWAHRFDAVMDLQNHRISKIIRKLLRAKAWVEFDRSSPQSAGKRTQNTIEALWSWRIEPETFFQPKQPTRAGTLLQQAGHRAGNKLVVLNPAGYCPSRHWPLASYEAFAKRWQAAYPLTQFVLLLLPAHQEAANYLDARLGEHCINLTGKANPVEAFEILQQCDFMLTEDSGLMHMAWVQGVPTLALFSSSRKDWSAPQGAWSMCLDSSDLECGPCLLPVCKFDDNRCLTRYTPEFVMACAEKILPHAKPHHHVHA